MVEALRTLPLARYPIRLGRFILPAPASSPVVQVHAGRTGVHPDAAGVMNTQGWMGGDGARAASFVAA